jgi:HAE1 family hydrophobic/amphiphilic exporter-1
VVDDAIVVVEGAAHNIERGMSGHDAAISAMDVLFAPIVSITLVLISVFLPSAFLPGLTGRMYSQFALVIAATALLSAINAATLKPTQCALWLRQPAPPEQRNFFYRGFNAVYNRLERGYARLIGRLVAHSNISVIVALILIGVGGYGLSRVPTGFIPIEDQGYLLVAAQLPDGAALDRTQRVLDQISELAGKTPGVDQVISIAGISALDNSSSLANAGVAYLVLKEWSARGPGQDLRSLFVGLNEKMAAIPEARILVIPPPPIQGIGNAAGFAMQVQLRDGNSDFGKLQAIAGAIVANAQTQSALQRVSSSFRSMVPQFDVEVDRIKTQTLHVTTDQIFSTLSSYMGSTYVNQFNKFGRTFQVYTQADAQFRLTPRDIENLMVRNSQGDMVPLGTVAKITPAVGPSLISLYNLYPSATVIGLPATGYSSGQSMTLMEEIAAKTLPPGTGYEWTAMSYQEKVVGGQIYLAFGLALLLVYLVLAGQYESWYAPISVILAVPLSLLGPMIVLTGLRIENNLYTQIGHHPVDRLVGEERHPDRRGRARAPRARPQAAARIGGRGGAGAVPADPDDVVCLHSRGGAAGACDRRRRQRPQVDRHHRVFRHDRIDLPRGAVRAGVLRRDPAVRELAQAAQGQSGGAANDSAGAERYTLTIRLPRFSPASNPIRAFGVFSRPLITSSWTFNLPAATQDCRSLNASSR